MYPETVCLSRSNGDELTILLGNFRRRNTMQSSRAAEGTDLRDLMVRLQQEALDLSTKRPTPHALHSEPSNASPASPHLIKKRRVLWSSEFGVSSWKLPNHSIDRTHSNTDSADGIDAANTANGAQSHLLESFSVCSSVDGEPRCEANALGLTQRRIPSLGYSSSLVVTAPSLGAVTSPVTQPIPAIPLALARHTLSTAAAAAVVPATAVAGADSYLRGIPANRSVTATDSSSLQPPSAALPVGEEYAPVAVVPYASSSSTSSYFQALLRRPQSNAPRADRPPSEASISPPRPTIQSIDSRRRAGGYGSTVAPPPPPPRNGGRLEEEVRDAGYLERRRKNNESAKRSRDARRQKEEETAFRAAELERENLSLKAELLLLRRESAELHHLLYAITDLPRR